MIVIFTVDVKSVIIIIVVINIIIVYYILINFFYNFINSDKRPKFIYQIFKSYISSNKTY